MNDVIKREPRESEEHKICNKKSLKREKKETHKQNQRRKSSSDDADFIINL